MAFTSLQSLSTAYHSVSSAFWSESFWLPANLTWDVLKSDNPEGPYYPHTFDLLLSLPIALLLIVARFIVERILAYFFGRPIAIAMGVNPGKASSAANMRLERNSVLEAHFKRDRRPDKKALQQLSMQTGKTEREIERWFRKKRNVRKSSAVKKFGESWWKLVYYTLIWIYGVYILYDKAWVYWAAYSFVDYPTQHIATPIFYYYVIQLGFYISSAITLFFDVRRSDYNELMFHHFLTCGLICVSWVDCNVRMGTLILLSHDFNDILLEATKLASYVNASYTDLLFVVFIFFWILTRMTYFPLSVIGATWSEGFRANNWYPAGYFFNILLVSLLCLHVFWFVLIIRVAIRKAIKGKVEDVRSESEQESTSENEAVGVSKAVLTKPLTNGQNGHTSALKNGVFHSDPGTNSNGSGQNNHSA